jgi:hypothetical protein
VNGKNHTIEEQPAMTTEHFKNYGDMVPIRDVIEVVIREKLWDAMIPGFQAEFDPVEAELAGAFIEDTLSEEEAMGSFIDLFVVIYPEMERR